MNTSWSFTKTAVKARTGVNHDATTTTYDVPQRKTAARLNQAHPNWHVMWGVHSRRLWAFPLFDVPPGTIVSAGTPDDLVAQMRQVEMIARHGPPPYRQPPPAGPG